MKNFNIFSPEDISRTYEKVHDLLLTRYIIKTYSTNKSDIRDVALDGLDLKHVKRVLELGCGYGFFIEKLKGLLHDNSVIIGIDMVENNREPFLHSVASIQYKGEFINSNANIIKEMASESFDLIVTSYSLYFFPELIRDIARILAKDGIFIAITHSKFSLQEAIQFSTSCMSKLGLTHIGNTFLNELFVAFSLENGQSQLQNYFNLIECFEFKNAMIFPYKNIDDCIFYIQNKKNLIYKEILDWKPEKINEMQKCIEISLREYTKSKGMISVNKDDAVFRCYNPLI